MSRILRRPMFRGGRVDARGTGIASGLGYKKGGRVNYQMGGNVRGGIVNLPGGYFQTANERMEEWKKGLNNPYKETPITLQDKIDAYTIGETPDWVYPKIDYRTGKAIAPPFPDLPGMSFPRDAEAMGVSEEFVPTKSKENGSNNLNGGDGPPEKTKAEKLEEYQKMFEEAYGSGRGEDISNMLLSFAGKALKPEATVKSSFGEFFEEEAKRPSERKKYKDAATTGAINAFLAGEKDFSTFMNQMKAMEHGVDYKAGVDAAKQKNYSVTDYVLADKKNSEGKAIEIGTRKVMENKGVAGKINKIKAKENTDELLIEENINKVFYDTDNKEVFLVTIVDGEIVKDYTDWYR
jgi:hypothetical protein